MPGRAGRRTATSAGRSSALPTILLVDDHPLWRDSLRRLLERRKAGRIVGEASDGDEALTLASSERPDIVIMDIDLPTIDGIEATRRIHADNPDAKVLFLSALNAKEDVVAAVRAGASAYLLKTAGSSEVVEAVERVHSGELVFPPSLAGFVLEQLRDRATDDRRKAPRRAPPREANEFVREGEFWTLVYEGETIRMKDSKGLRYIADLLRSPGEGIHVMELVAAHEGVDPAQRHKGAAAEGLPKDSGRTAGSLDPQARSAYRARLEELRDQAEEAEAWHDSERAARAREEMDFLAGELARSVGLGGRDRKAGSPSERMRVNVSRAISAAIRRVEPAHARLAAHLAASVKTGMFCSYEPVPSVSWRLS